VAITDLRIPCGTWQDEKCYAAAGCLQMSGDLVVWNLVKYCNQVASEKSYWRKTCNGIPKSKNARQERQFQRDLFQKLKRREPHIENALGHLAGAVEPVISGEDIIAGYAK